MPDDETVNQMIARHEEEFDLFMVSTPAGVEVAFPPHTPKGAQFPTRMKLGAWMDTHALP